MPNNIGSSAGITAERDGAFAFMLTTLAAGFEPEETDATARLLERLYHHLKRASDFYRDRTGDSLVSDMEKMLLDTADVGMIIWNGDLKIVAMSATAYEMTKSRGIPKSLSRSRTTFAESDANRQLNVMLDRFYEGQTRTRAVLAELDVTLVRVEGDAERRFSRVPVSLRFWKDGPGQAPSRCSTDLPTAMP